MHMWPRTSEKSAKSTAWLRLLPSQKAQSSAKADSRMALTASGGSLACATVRVRVRVSVRVRVRAEVRVKVGAEVRVMSRARVRARVSLGRQLGLRGTRGLLD